MAILILILLIALNGVLAMAEIALISSRKVRLEQLAERGNRGARQALQLAASPTRFLSTVQVGITLIGIVAGAFGERALATDFAAQFSKIQGLEPYSHAIATTLVVLGLTYFSLVLGELVPKRLALNSPERIASFTAAPMRLLSRVTAPFVHLLTFSTDLILRLFPGAAVNDEIVTEEEIKSLIEKGTRAGLFLQAERELVDRIFRVGDQRVSSLMVPRADIAWLSADATTERVRLAVATSSHSHFPVCKGGLENIIGVVHLKDMIQAGLLTQKIDLRTLARKPLYVPEAMPALRLLDDFRKSRSHIAFVFDEYGVVVGLVTLNDIIESLLGQMIRHGEVTEPMTVRRDENSWLLDGSLPVQDLKAIMHIDRLPHEARTSFQTLAGFVMTYLGRIPSTGEQFTFDRFQFEVVDMDRHRIDKVMLTMTRPKSTDDQERPS